jgi:hypothetical protein
MHKALADYLYRDKGVLLDVGGVHGHSEAYFHGVSEICTYIGWHR